MVNCNVIKANNIANLSDRNKERFKKATQEEKILLEGVACDKKVEPLPNFRKAPCESIVANGQNNSQIVVGRDRPSSLLSGYGGRGDSQAGAMDLVVGRKSANIQETDENGEEIFIDPDFESDAARIYLSQKTDIDSNFNIAQGGVGNSVTRSGIGIKADSVRIIGREGIKLVTQTENKNSLGGDIISTKGIDLIAGNNDVDLQPLVKGDNLVEFLNITIDLIKKSNSLINSLATKQVALDAALSSHTHPTLCPAGGGVAAPAPAVVTACAIDATAIASLDFPSHAFILTNAITAAQDYIKPGGSKFIISKYNKTN